MKHTDKKSKEDEFKDSMFDWCMAQGWSKEYLAALQSIVTPITAQIVSIDHMSTRRDVTKLLAHLLSEIVATWPDLKK